MPTFIIYNHLLRENLFMTQKNQKFGERKSDLVCPCCERELVWKGSIMEGKMVCTTSWCVKNDEHSKEFSGNKVDYAILDDLGKGD